MSESTENQKNFDKKLLDNPFVGSLVVPIAIVLVGALIIFGVTKMISSEHSYKNLVHEMKSKTFGNKWVAALELSKIISAKKIPQEDIPWLLENMEEIYTSTVDPRTRDFIVVAAGTLGDERALPILEKALADQGTNSIRFHAVVALANMPKGINFNWSKVVGLMASDDQALTQAAVLALGTHSVKDAEGKIVEALNSGAGYGVRYAAATALTRFKNEVALETINEILNLDERSHGASMTTDSIRGLKFNILNAAQDSEWTRLVPMIEKMLTSEKDIKVTGRAKEVLNLLKK
jgi:hypothetical protein